MPCWLRSGQTGAAGDGSRAAAGVAVGRTGRSMMRLSVVLAGGAVYPQVGLYSCRGTRGHATSTYLSDGAGGREAVSCVGGINTSESMRRREDGSICQAGEHRGNRSKVFSQTRQPHALFGFKYLVGAASKVGTGPPISPLGAL